MKARNVLIAATIAAGILTALPASAANAPIPNTRTTGEVLCLPLEWRFVADGHAIRNDTWLASECITNSAGRPNFTVTTNSPGVKSGKVTSFPEIFTGCTWDACSPNSPLPRRVRALPDAATGWVTRQKAGGAWNAAYDIWITRHRQINGQSNGAELMIWLGYQGLASARGWPIYRIDGVRWYLERWTATNGSVDWHYMQFRRVARTSSVSNLTLAPFFHVAEHLRLVSQWWWVEGVNAGFEIWRGGKGLATTWFATRGL